MTINEQDFELIRSFLDGSEPAFNKIVNKYITKIYWHARRMTGNHLDADDILQEVLIVLYNKLKDFHFKSSLYTYIYKITSTRCLNLINKRKIKSFFSFDDVDENKFNYDQEVIKSIENKEKLKQLDNVLQKLPPKQRQVFLLKSFDELTYEEISEITGTSVGSLKASYFHAVNKITEQMNNE